MNMEETKHWIGFKKVLYACDFCGKDVVADCVIEVEDEGGDVPVLVQTDPSTMTHRCGGVLKPGPQYR